jgi:hypothetical protein
MLWGFAIAPAPTGAARWAIVWRGYGGTC